MVWGAVAFAEPSPLSPAPVPAAVCVLIAALESPILPHLKGTVLLPEIELEVGA